MRIIWLSIILWVVLLQCACVDDKVIYAPVTNASIESIIIQHEKKVSVARSKSLRRPISLATSKDFVEPTKGVSVWSWPAKGPVIGQFSSINKGINIGGRYGAPIFATAAGKIVYSGNGIRGYGNLIIIKHNSTFLTAYAHNSVVRVKEGEWVKRGQKIAEMGNSGTRRVMLHFEIRRKGEPVNPLDYLR